MLRNKPLRQLSPPIVHDQEQPFFECASMKGLDVVHGEQEGWESSGFNHRHTSLFYQAEGLPPISMVRDADHLNWRYPMGGNSPYWKCEVTKGKRISALIVIRFALIMGLPFAFIMEWMWEKGSQHEGLLVLDKAISFARVRKDLHGGVLLSPVHAQK